MQLNLTVEVPNDTYRLSPVAVYHRPQENTLIVVWKLDGTGGLSPESPITRGVYGTIDVTVPGYVGDVWAGKRKDYVLGATIEDVNYTRVQQLDDILQIKDKVICLVEFPLLKLLKSPPVRCEPIEPQQPRASDSPLIAQGAFPLGRPLTPRQQQANVQPAAAAQAMMVRPSAERNVYSLFRTLYNHKRYSLGVLGMAVAAGVGFFAANRWRAQIGEFFSSSHKPKP